jgi:hypothetical protein
MSTPNGNDGSTVAITPEQRQVLLNSLRLRVSGLGDASLMCEDPDAADYCRRHAAVLWLLADLLEDDPRGSMVTLPADPFAEWLRAEEAGAAEDADAASWFAGDRMDADTRAYGHAQADQALDLVTTCRALLGVVA